MGKRIMLFLFLMPVLWAGILYDSSGELQEKSHSVEVIVKNRIAFTKVIHVFTNTGSKALKVKYQFETPPGAVIYGLAIWRDGKKIQGTSVERFCKKRVNRETKNVDHAVVAETSYRDNAYDLYMYPVQPDKLQRVEILYWCMLPYNGKVNYVYPMHQRQRPDKATDFSFKMHLDNNTSFVYSSNRLDIKNKWITFCEPHFYYQKDINICLRLQNLNIPPLYYEQQEQNGFFTAFVDAPVSVDRRKAITFLLDISGSMTDKWEYIKQTLCKYIDMLNKRHYFQIMTFGSQTNAKNF